LRSFENIELEVQPFVARNPVIPSYLGYSYYRYCHGHKFKDEIDMNTQDATLFEETLRVTTINNDKYDRVARYAMVSEDNQVALTIDINVELFPVAAHDEITLVLASTLALDGTKDDGKGWKNTTAHGGEASLADMFEYVCHGKIYKFEDSEDGQTM
jgi:DNA-directed RNA polymerase I, II, and III subunit RPABC3